MKSTFLNNFSKQQQIIIIIIQQQFTEDRRKRAFIKSRQLNHSKFEEISQSNNQQLFEEMSGSSSSNGRYSVGGSKQEQTVGATATVVENVTENFFEMEKKKAAMGDSNNMQMPIAQRATATQLIRGGGQNAGNSSPKSQKRVNIRFIQGKVRGQPQAQGEPTASSAQVPPNSATETNLKRKEYGMQMDTSSAIRMSRERPHVPQNSAVADPIHGSQLLGVNSIVNSAVYGHAADGTDSSICRTQISLNDMTNDFDMSPTFKKSQQVQIHDDRPSVSLNNFQKYPKKNQPASLINEKTSDKKNTIPFQSSEAHTSINKLNQNSQILYATKKKQRATDELQESKSYKIPKQTLGKFGLMSQNTAKQQRQAIVNPSAVKQKTNIERKFIIKLKSKDSRVSRQNSSEISQEKDSSMQIDQPNPTKSQSQSRKNILKNRLIEINDRLPSVLNNYPGDKGDVSNLNTTQMSGSQDLPPKQPKQLNYKKDRDRKNDDHGNNGQLALDQQVSSNDQREFEEQYNYNLQLQKFHAQSQKLKSLNRIASDNLPGVQNQKLLNNVKKSVRNNNDNHGQQQLQSTHSLGQKLVQNYSCNTPKPQTLKQTILSFSSKNNSISALKKPGQSVMNRQGSSNEGIKGVPVIMVNSTSDLANSSQQLLFKNKQESKTPQIKNYKVRTSDGGEMGGNQQMTARMNYYNLLGKPDIRAMTSISNNGKADIEFSSLDFSKQQSLIESYSISSMASPDQQPVLIHQYPSQDECKSCKDPDNQPDFLYVPSLPQIVMKTMKRQIDGLMSNPTTLDTVDFSYIITQRSGQHKYLQSLIFMQQGQCIAFTLVSGHPCFRVLKRMLLVMKPYLIQLQQMSLSPTLGFLLSFCLHHLNLNSSGLLLDLYFDQGLLSISSSQPAPIKVENNLISASQNIFDGFENYPFCQALLCISSSDLVNTVLNLLQEKKVLLITNRVHEAAITIEAIISLLKPFRWPSGILTVLTPDLIDYLDAPFPFIAGVDTQVWEQILTRRGGQLDEEITTVNVDARIEASIAGNKPHQTLDYFTQTKGSKACQFSFAKPFVEKLDRIKQKFLEGKILQDASWLKLTLEIKYLFLQMMVTILSNLDSCVNKDLLKKNLEQFEESVAETCETRDSRSLQNQFNRPTVRDYIDEGKFVKLHSADCKQFRTRLYESQIFANLLELENRMKYLMPGALQSQQVKYMAAQPHGQDTLIFVNFLKILDTMTQSKQFANDWDTWSAAVIEKRLDWVQKRRSCKYQISRAWPHYEELIKSKKQKDEVKKDKDILIVKMAPMKYERILRPSNHETVPSLDGHGQINQILQSTCPPQKHEPKLRQINLFFQQRDSFSQNIENTGKIIQKSNSKRNLNNPDNTESSSVQIPYNRASQGRQACQRCFGGPGGGNSAQRCICSHRSSLVVQDSKISGAPAHGPGLIVSKNLEHRGSYVQINGNKFIKKKKPTNTRKKSELEDDEPERTLEFGEQRESRESKHGKMVAGGGAIGGDGKAVKRVKMFQHANLQIAEENPSRGSTTVAVAQNQPIGTFFKNTGKLRPMTEYEEEQYLDETDQAKIVSFFKNDEMRLHEVSESANIPLSNHVMPFTKLNNNGSTYDEDTQRIAVHLLDKYGNHNIERPEQQMNSAAITDEETEDHNDQLYYQDEERASLPIASSMKPLIQQDHHNTMMTMTIDHSSVTQAAADKQPGEGSMFDRIGQLITKLWQGDEVESSADAQTTNQDSSQKMAIQKSLNEDVQMVSMLDM